MAKEPPFDRAAELAAEAWRQKYRKGGWRKAKRCDHCHGFYYPRQGNQRFCSKKCLERAKWARRRAKQQRAAERAAKTSV